MSFDTTWQYFRENLEAFVIFYLVGTLFVQRPVIQTTKAHCSEGVLLQEYTFAVKFVGSSFVFVQSEVHGIDNEHVVKGVKQSRFG